MERMKDESVSKAPGNGLLSPGSGAADARGAKRSAAACCAAAPGQRNCSQARSNSEQGALDAWKLASHGPRIIRIQEGNTSAGYFDGKGQRRNRRGRDKREQRQRFARQENAQRGSRKRAVRGGDFSPRPRGR